MIDGLSTEWTKRWKAKQKYKKRYESPLPKSIQEELKNNWVTKVDRRKQDKRAWNIGLAIVLLVIAAWVLALSWFSNIT